MRRNKAKLTLDRDATLALLDAGIWPEGLDNKFAVKSLWLCELLNEREKIAGFQYNAAFQRWFEHEFSRPESSESDILGTLIYNAQGYRREMNIAAEGYRRASPDVLAEFEGRQAVAVPLGDGGARTVKVKRLGGELRLLKPNGRTCCYVTYLDWWIKAA